MKTGYGVLCIGSLLCRAFGRHEKRFKVDAGPRLAYFYAYIRPAKVRLVGNEIGEPTGRDTLNQG